MKLLPYLLFEKKIFILALEMASPGINQHCASCTGTLSFRIYREGRPCWWLAGWAAIVDRSGGSVAAGRRRCCRRRHHRRRRLHRPRPSIRGTGDCSASEPARTRTPPPSDWTAETLATHSDSTIRYDTRCYFNVRSKADISQLNLPHGTDN